MTQYDSLAPVVQWIEQIRPKDEIEVRFLSRAPETEAWKIDNHSSMGHRVEKMNSLVREIFGELLDQEISLKQGVLVTIAKVDTTPDFRYTRVSVSVFPEQEEGYALATLRHEQSRLQKALNSKLSLKIRPRILIEPDHTEQSADVIEKLLLEIKQETKDA